MSGNLLSVDQPAKSDGDSPQNISVEVLVKKDNLIYNAEGAKDKTAGRVKFEDIETKVPFPQGSDANPGSLEGDGTPIMYPEL